MEIRNIGPWTYYLGEDYGLDEDKCGKWMYFFNNKNYISKICKEAIKNNIVKQCKHTNEEEGVSCFYLDCDDIEGHKKVLRYFLKNNLIKRTKNGRLCNISFKLDEQTKLGQYGDNYKSDIKLDKFVDLKTGELR